MFDSTRDIFDPIMTAGRPGLNRQQELWHSPDTSVLHLIQQFSLVNSRGTRPLAKRLYALGNIGSGMVAMPDLAIRVQIRWLIVTEPLRFSLV